MAASIDQASSSSNVKSSLGEDAVLITVEKIKHNIGDIKQLALLAKDTEEDQGFVTINDDKTLRVILKRPGGKYWPSVIHNLPDLPTKLFCNRKTNVIYVGLANGAISEFTLSADKNSLENQRSWRAHAGQVTGLIQSPLMQQIYSCGRDRTVTWHALNDLKKTGVFNLQSPCTCLELDVDSKTLFVGDESGSIHVLRVNESTATQISKLGAHTTLGPRDGSIWAGLLSGTILDLAWDPKRQWLFSASSDNLVIMWDIGRKEGIIYEFVCHTSKVVRLALAQSSGRLFSLGDDGLLVCWDLRAKRSMSPAWVDTDRCERCGTPFIWNVRTMWNMRAIGSRRHHCRICGMSLCSRCAEHFSKYPPMGYEKEVRVCADCYTNIQGKPQVLTPLAVTCSVSPGALDMCFRESTDRLFSLGYDRSVSIWDTSKMTL